MQNRLQVTTIPWGSGQNIFGVVFVSSPVEIRRAGSNKASSQGIDVLGLENEGTPTVQAPARPEYFESILSLTRESGKESLVLRHAERETNPAPKLFVCKSGPS